MNHVDSLLQARLRPAPRTRGLAASDPSSVFAIKSLFYPVVAVVSLFACVLAWNETIYGPNFLLAVLAFLIVATVFDVAQIYRLPGDRFFLLALFAIVQRWALVMAFLWAVLHLASVDALLRSPVFLSWSFATPLVLWAGQVAAQSVYTRRTSGVGRARKAVIVGLTELGQRLEKQFEDDGSLLTKVLGYFDDRDAGRLPPDGSRKVLGKPASLAAYILNNDINVVYVTLPMTRHPRILGLLEDLRDSTVSIYFVPDLYAFDVIQARIDVIGGMPVVAVCESPFYGARSIAKRLSDLIIGAALVVACSPLLLFTAIGVRLSSPGPVLFRQKRYGLDGRQISIYKFRSMTVTEDGATHYTQVIPKDGRLTPFGAFIRKTSLDELPQLFNVLHGTLSLVGPRPHVIAVNEQYRKLIPGYMIRHKVKPGITGWAQVNGARGGDDLDAMKRRIEFDLDYLRNWSLLLDLSIIVRTAALVWRDSRAY